jgi:hypothetical protein
MNVRFYGVVKCVTDGGEGVKKIGESVNVVYGRPLGLSSNSDTFSFNTGAFNSTIITKSRQSKFLNPTCVNEITDSALTFVDEY